MGLVGRFKAEVSKMGYPLMGRAHAEVAWLWRRLTLAAGAQAIMEKIKGAIDDVSH